MKDLPTHIKQDGYIATRHGDRYVVVYIEPWFGEVGNRTQYMSDLPVNKLVKDGFLEIIGGG